MKSWGGTNNFSFSRRLPYAYYFSKTELPRRQIRCLRLLYGNYHVVGIIFGECHASHMLKTSFVVFEK
jgi:hypothetical protein